ncbi:MAG: 1-acyl-sn-glycerol-3-phosphate acyltransferase [Anaerolineales bacterium]|nr:1-acyl-sn-glycerol-3-phosphate acyltransferase [Anaerolineales bacterium]
MTMAFWAVTNTIKGLTRVLCRVEDELLDQVPTGGPLILVCNHINFLDVPLVFTHLQPRPITGFAKSETWDSPVLRPLFDLWGAIPLKRGEADLGALRKGLQALEQGKIVAISPEGTRSGDGRLRKGLPGVVTLALRSGAPLLPLVYYGGETFHQNLRRLHRTNFCFNIGRQFRLHPRDVKITREVRQEITDEIMYQLAALLPPEYRGVYADLDRATTRYLKFTS